MKHTKPPWTIARTRNGKKIYILDGEAERLICQIGPMPQQQTEGNSHLIAAAPELLDACIELRDVLNHDCGYDHENHLLKCIAPATLKASAAITKATG